MLHVNVFEIICDILWPSPVSLLGPNISNNLNIYRWEDCLGSCKPALQFQLFDSIVVSFQSLKVMEVPGIEPGASHMQSARSTTELHPHSSFNLLVLSRVSMFKIEFPPWQNLFPSIYTVLMPNYLYKMLIEGLLFPWPPTISYHDKCWRINFHARHVTNPCKPLCLLVWAYRRSNSVYACSVIIVWARGHSPTVILNK